jgi:hypothetical protein
MNLGPYLLGSPPLGFVPERRIRGSADPAPMPGLRGSPRALHTRLLAPSQYVYVLEKVVQGSMVCYRRSKVEAL